MRDLLLFLLVELGEGDISPRVRITNAASQHRTLRISATSSTAEGNESDTHSLIPIQIANKVLLGLHGASVGESAKYSLNKFTWSANDRRV